MEALEKVRRSPLKRSAVKEKDLAKLSFFATMKENCAATEARVLEESLKKNSVFGASFWAFFAKHSWG